MRSGAIGSRRSAADFANLHVGDHRVRACVRGVGIDVPGDSRGDRVIPSAVAGRLAAPANWPHSVPDIALEDRSAADGSALAYVFHYGLLTAVPRKWRGVPGGTDGPFWGDSAACRDGFVVDGFGRLAAAGRHAAGTSRGGWAPAGIWRVGALGGAKEPGRVGPRRPFWSCDSGDCFTGVGERVSLLKACWRTWLTFAGSGDAKPCRWSLFVDCGNRIGRSWGAAS